MSDKKAIRKIVWSGKNSDYDGWSEKHLAKAEYKGYHKLLLYRKNMNGFDVVSTEQGGDDIEAKSTKAEEDEKILKLDKLNKQAFVYLVLNTYIQNTTQCRTAF